MSKKSEMAAMKYLQMKNPKRYKMIFKERSHHALSEWKPKEWIEIRLYDNNELFHTVTLNKE